MIIKRTLWTISKGTSIGYIDSIYKEGFFINANYISFRQTNSKYAFPLNTRLNLRHLSLENKQKLNGYLLDKKPIILYFSKEFINCPYKAEMFFETYVTDIDRFDDE